MRITLGGNRDDVVSFNDMTWRHVMKRMQKSSQGDSDIMGKVGSVGSSWFRALICSAGCMSLAFLHACSEPPPAPVASIPEAAVQAGDAPAQPPSSDDGVVTPGTSPAVEWRANGFDQLPEDYQWSGSARRDEGFEPNFSLSVPETDDIVWSSGCAVDGQVSTRIYFNAPAGFQGTQETFRVESDVSSQMLEYPARYEESGQAPSFELIQPVDDPMFATLQSGNWAYMQIGQGDTATKIRVSLTGAAEALGTFLPACAVSDSATVGAADAVVRYTCDGDRTVSATYIGNDSDNPSVRLDVDNREFTLNQVVSGSGARYESVDGRAPGKTLAWVTKADTGHMIEGDVDDTSGESETVVSCQEVAD